MSLSFAICHLAVGYSRWVLVGQSSGQLHIGWLSHFQVCSRAQLVSFPRAQGDIPCVYSVMKCCKIVDGEDNAVMLVGILIPVCACFQVVEAPWFCYSSCRRNDSGGCCLSLAACSLLLAACSLLLLASFARWRGVQKSYLVAVRVYGCHGKLSG